MSLDQAKNKFREFHLKEPNEVVPIPTEIPRIVVPIGFCPQISYISNKWNKENNWQNYIHYWSHPTLVCTSKLQSRSLNPFYSDQRIDLGDHRNEVTFLGYAIDFNISEDDRSKMPEEDSRLEDTEVVSFNDNPKNSRDYVVCSPNGRVVYVISENGKEIYAFVNENCKVTKHGIEG